jgi:hypothetical protein
MIRPLLIAQCLILTLLWMMPPSVAEAGKLHFHGSTGVAGPCADDGHTGAPTGTPQFAARRAVWTALAGAGGAAPPCQIADVDYNTGVDPNVTLLSPSAAVAALGNANVTYNSTNNLITCAGGATGLTIQNIDFTIGGTRSGGGFLINGCDNLTLKNVKMWLGCFDPSPQYPMKQQTNSSGLTISNWDISNPNGQEAAGCTAGTETIYFTGPGLQKVIYTRISGAPEHNVTFTCASGATCTAYERYNSFSATGWDQGEHVNGVQWLGAFASSDISYNLWYNPQPTVADTVRTACFGPQTCTNDAGGSPSSVAISNGQVIVKFLGTNQAAMLPGMNLTGSGFTGTAYICAVTDYIGPAIGPDYVKLTLGTSYPACATTTTTTSTGTAQVQNAYPFGKANDIRYVNQGSISTQMLAGSFVGNVLDGDGPILTGTNAVACGGQGVGTEVNGVTVSNNYWNPTGYQGSFWLNAAFCLNATGSGNKNMVTNANLPVS